MVAANTVQARSILVATPCLRAMVHLPHMTAVIALQSWCHDRGYGFAHRAMAGVSVIAHARNLLASYFLAQEQHSHMVFIDDDIGFNADDIGRMIDMADDADVIAAMCPKRKFDWERIKQAVIDNPDIDSSHLANLSGDYQGMFALPDEVPFVIGPNPLDVLRIGAGIMLIARGCLEAVRAHGQLPSFSDARHANHPIFPFFSEQTNEGALTGEDFHFCNLVRAAKGRILGCPWPVVTHSGNYDYVGDLPGIAHYL